MANTNAQVETVKVGEGAGEGVSEFDAEGV